MWWRRLVYFLLLQQSFASKILIIAPSSVEGDFLWINVFVKALLDQDHHVTVLSSHRAKLRHHNYFEIAVEPSIEVEEVIPDRYKYDLRHTSEMDNLFLTWEKGLKSSENILQDPKVQRFIKHEEHFDLVIFEDSFHESLLMFGHKFNCPVMMLSSHGPRTEFDLRAGNVPSPAFLPFHLSTYSSQMSFFQRMRNTALTYQYWLWREFYYLPAHQKLADKYFQYLKKYGRSLPKIKAIEQNISVTLVNTHISLIEPRPQMPGLIYIGGAHLQPPEPLPEKVQDFLDGARHGAIIFSLGSDLETKNMPIGKLRIFANVFKKLKQRIIMKFEDPLVPALPPNVITLKWLPQADILAHKNVVLLITSGSNLAIQEAVNAQVPVLVIPFFGEQQANGKRAERAGYGLTLKFSDLSAMTLGTKITELITDSGYKERVRFISEIFQDNLVSRLEEAVYWIEYVLQHNGAKFLKSSSVGMSWLKHGLYDVYVGYAICLVAIIFIAKKIINVIMLHKEAIQAKVRLAKSLSALAVPDKFKRSSLS